MITSKDAGMIIGDRDFIEVVACITDEDCGDPRYERTLLFLDPSELREQPDTVMHRLRGKLLEFAGIEPGTEQTLEDTDETTGTATGNRQGDKYLVAFSFDEGGRMVRRGIYVPVPDDHEPADEWPTEAVPLRPDDV